MQFFRGVAVRREDQFHVGIVAEDLQATTDALAAALGYEWGPEVGSTTEVTLPGGPLVVELRCVFSVSVPRLEIVRSIPGTLWESAAGLHHIGYWSDDVAADVAELTSHGYVEEASRLGPDGRPYFTFCRSSNGFRIELVTRAAQAQLRQCWAAPGSAT
jgi:hypothetical protein